MLSPLPGQTVVFFEEATVSVEPGSQFVEAVVGQARDSQDGYLPVGGASRQQAQGSMILGAGLGGAGLGGILTDIAAETELTRGKRRIELDGREYVVETALRADVALIHADRADTFGNLDYVATAQNFNPLMAMAAPVVIAEAERVLPLGGLAPDDVHTPGPFVDHLVELSEISEEYAVVRR